MRKLLKTESHGNLIASRRAYQSVNLVEVQRWKLVNDDTDRDVAFGIDTGYQTVKHKSVQRADDLFLFGVVGNHKIARTHRVGNLQVKIIAGEHPIGFRRYKACGIYAESTHHTFKLVVGFVLVCGLEGSHQRGYLIVHHQNVEHLRILASEERQHMGHIRKLTCYSVRLNLVSVLVLIPAAVNQYQLTHAVDIGEAVKVNEHLVLVGGYVASVLVHEVKHDLAVLVQSVEIVPVAYHKLQFLALMRYIAFQFFPFQKTCRVEINEEIDDRREEILCRIGEESLRAALFLATALVERGKKRGRRLRSRREVGNVFTLDWIDTVGILHIGKIDYAETAAIRQITVV